MIKRRKSLEALHTHTHTHWNNLQIKFVEENKLDLIYGKIGLRKHTKSMWT